MRAIKNTRMRAEVSQTHRRSIMILRPKIILLSSLDQKRPKAEKKSFKQPLELVPQSIMGDTVDCFEKVTRMRALGLTDPQTIYHDFMDEDSIAQ